MTTTLKNHIDYLVSISDIIALATLLYRYRGDNSIRAYIYEAIDKKHETSPSESNPEINPKGIREG